MSRRPRFVSVTGLIVAGGIGRRMGGVEKALLQVGGRTLAERTVDVLSAIASSVIVATPRPEPWRGLAVRIVEDEEPGRGPLGGLAVGLRAAATPWVLAVAGDMPHLDERLLASLCARAIAAGRTVIPRVGGRPEPLHAVYRADHARRAAEALAAGVGRAWGWLDEGEVLWVDDVPAGAFRNVNTPEDLRSVDGRRAPGDTLGP